MGPKYLLSMGMVWAFHGMRQAEVLLHSGKMEASQFLE
jgi:hypothetical protein